MNSAPTLNSHLCSDSCPVQQSAAVAPLLKEIYSGVGGGEGGGHHAAVAASSLSRAGVILTIHNIAFQGWLTPDFLTRVGLDPSKVYRPESLMDDGRRVSV